MRRLPHSAALLTPSKVVDEYNDEVSGPLAPNGDPFPAWLQTETSTEATADGSVVVVTRKRLHVRYPGPSLSNDDVVEVAGARYRVKGDLIANVNPRGRGRFAVVDLDSVSRGG